MGILLFIVACGWIAYLTSVYGCWIYLLFVGFCCLLVHCVCGLVGWIVFTLLFCCFAVRVVNSVVVVMRFTFVSC